MYRKLKSLFAGILLVSCITAPAYARDYHVEVIIFERPAGNQADQEIWNFSPAAVGDKLEQLRLLSTRASSKELNTSLSYLGAAEASLRGSGLRILKAGSWRQPSAVYQAAPLVSLGQAGSTLPQAYIRVYRTSLIFADIDLLLAPPAALTESETVSAVVPHTDLQSETQPAAGAAGTATPAITESVSLSYPARYFLSEKRRLKFEEVHYFDHPMFGAILGVWPAE